MKAILLTGFLFMLVACNVRNNDEQMLQAKIDSLQKLLIETYKPGFGEFMSGIQTHHAKLWFAGKNSNWPLADFEIHEIEEALEDVQKFCRDRPEVKAMAMITPALDSTKNSIQQKSLPLFKNSFLLLTTTCNNCHKATDHAFNVVTIPTQLPVVNQDFKSAQ